MVPGPKDRVQEPDGDGPNGVRVLVTNDDGIDQPGLQAVARRLVEGGHEVRVYGPSREFSGSSSSLGTVVHDARIEVCRVDLPGLDGVPAVSFDAPPAVAVRAVCAGRFGWRPDLVVSGVNPGFNSGRVVLHSGTVGAVLTAAGCDVPGIAVSTTWAPDGGFDTAATLAAWLADVVAAQAPDEPTALNLNVPAVPLAGLRGVAAATLSRTGLVDLDFEGDEQGMVVRRREHTPPFEPGSDAQLLGDGWATVTPLPLPWATATPQAEYAEALQQRWRERDAAIHRP